MINRTLLKYAAVLVGVLSASGSVSLFGQMYPERRYIRAGLKDYEKQQYAESEEHYRKALEKNPASWEAAFNLGDALYKQERLEEAAEVFKSLAENPSLTKEQSAKSYYNLGNTYFDMYDPMDQEAGKKSLKDAEQSYMKSLMANPDDMEAKYNLAYVQKMLEEDENQNDDNQNDQDNQDNEDNQGGQDNQSDQNDDQNNGDQDGDNEENDQQQDNGDGDDQQDQQQGEDNPRESNISREDAEAMLNAIQNQEDQTREKMNEQKGVAVGASGKNW